MRSLFTNNIFVDKDGYTWIIRERTDDNLAAMRLERDGKLVCSWVACDSDSLFNDKEMVRYLNEAVA